jgi:hypothetical protein
MKALLILGFIGCIYLHFKSQGNEVLQLDSLSTKQSAIKNQYKNKDRLPAISIVQKNTPSPSVASTGFVPSEDDQMITEADVQQDYDEDDLSQLPWDDIEEGWKTHLKEFLVSVDPEKADEIFTAYMEEKKKYVERVDFTDQDVSENSAPIVEDDAKEGELERLHAENLKEIFGDNYSKVESLHQEYVDSVQYLNRSSVKFSISL